MIASVSGVVSAVSPDGAVIEVGGIGLSVQCTPSTLAALRPGTTTSIPTSLVVREDSLTLYGFADADEREIFELLQVVSGVGPRLAQGVLATLSPDDLRAAVASEDLATLTKVSGIGKKGAERLVIELRDRIGPPRSGTSAKPAAAASAPWKGQLLDALQGLGWSAREAEAAVDALAPSVTTDTPDLSELLKQALRSLRRA